MTDFTFGKFIYKRGLLSILVLIALTCILAGCKEKKEVYPVELVEDVKETAEEEIIEEEPEEEQPVIVISNEKPESIKELTGEEDVDLVKDNDGSAKTDDGKIVVDLFMFMGQSNMSGVGGNPDKAPKVPKGQGYEFRAISDPTQLYDIIEPFGKNESFIGAICDFPQSKNGSLVSSFAIKYYEETGVPIVAVSASEGATTTERWLTDSYQADLLYRYTTALNWLENNGYKVRKRFAIWLQGESDAANNVSAEEYSQNMDNLIRGLFVNGLNKVFIITPGRTLTLRNYFDTIINCQISICKNSGYYGLGTTALSGISTEYMTDEWHYNQYVLDLLGEQCADSVAYYVNNQKEKCLYDYKNKTTYIPDLFDYTGDEVVEPIDISKPYDALEFKPVIEE